MKIFLKIPRRTFLFALFVLCSCLERVWNTKYTTISIDIGDHMKVGYIDNNRFHILNTYESSRSIPSTITILKEGVRIGKTAHNQFSFYLKNSFTKLKPLLGTQLGDREVEIYRKLFPFISIEKDSNRPNRYIFKAEGVADGFSLEELFAHMFLNIKRIFKSELDMYVSGAVITVPDASDVVVTSVLLDAAEIAGIYVYGFFDDVSAAAYSYAINNNVKFSKEPSYYLFHNVGSDFVSTGFYSCQERQIVGTYGNIRTVSFVDVLDVVSNKGYAGFDIDLIIRDFLIDEISKRLRMRSESEHQGNPRTLEEIRNDIVNDYKRMLILLMHSNKIKSELSTNDSHEVRISSLFFDYKDLSNIIITHKNLQEGLAKIIGFNTEMIGDMVKKMEDKGYTSIKGIGIIGGGSRKFIKEGIEREFSSKYKILTDLNSIGEMSALGGCLGAVYLSGKAYLKEIRLMDLREKTFSIAFDDENERSELFRMKDIGSSLTFNTTRRSDFNFSIYLDNTKIASHKTKNGLLSYNYLVEQRNSFANNTSSIVEAEKKIDGITDIHIEFFLTPLNVVRINKVYFTYAYEEKIPVNVNTEPARPGEANSTTNNSTDTQKQAKAEYKTISKTNTVFIDMENTYDIRISDSVKGMYTERRKTYEEEERQKAYRSSQIDRFRSLRRNLEDIVEDAEDDSYEYFSEMEMGMLKDTYMVTSSISDEEIARMDLKIIKDNIDVMKKWTDLHEERIRESKDFEYESEIFSNLVGEGGALTNFTDHCRKHMNSSTKNICYQFVNTLDKVRDDISNQKNLKSYDKTVMRAKDIENKIRLLKSYKAQEEERIKREKEDELKKSETMKAQNVTKTESHTIAPEGSSHQDL